MTDFYLPRTRRRLLKFGSVLVVAMLILASTIFRNHPHSLPTSMKQYQEQELQWTKCMGGFTCTNLLVPINYQELKQGRFTLKVIRFSARNQNKKRGSLVINPGGPGASGFNYAYNAQYIFSSAILDKYDIVGFDPRGVGHSVAIHCLSDKETDASYAADSKPDSNKELNTLLKQAQTYVSKCQKKTPHLADFSTSNSARDMDLLRSALGEKKLNYLGVSYGTYLGTLYAKYFPNNVGRVVLDGAIDPNATGKEQNLTQAMGFDQALSAFVEDCLGKEDCPLITPANAAITQIISLFHKVALDPLSSSSGRSVTESLVVLGTASALYDKSTGWPRLRDAIREAEGGSGNKFLALADDYTQREANGAYGNNETDAAFVIDCLDWPQTLSITQVKNDATDFAIKAPVFGPYLAFADLSCHFFPKMSTKRIHIDSINTTPIVIIGTTRDPATPYIWAERLHNVIHNSRLISLNGDGHTGYGHGSTCVDSAVDAYLLEGKIPKKDLFCTSAFG